MADRHRYRVRGSRGIRGDAFDVIAPLRREFQRPVDVRRGDCVHSCRIVARKLSAVTAGGHYRSR